MSDDRRRGDGFEDDFGGPLFPDNPADDRGSDTWESDTGEQRRLRFGPDDTGPLPHWTDPPTGEIPRLAPRADGGGTVDDADSDDVDVWSTFTTESPVWRDDEDEVATGVVEKVQPAFGAGLPHTGPTERVSRDPSGSVDRDPSAGFDRDPSGRVDRSGGFDRSGGADRDPSGQVPRGGLFDDTATSGFGGAYPSSGRRDPSGAVARTPGRTAERGGMTGEVPMQGRREPGRITIGTDPSGAPRRQPDQGRRRPSAQRSGRPIGPARTSAPPNQRNISAAIIAGGVIAAVFIVSLLIGAWATLVIAVAVLGVAGWEYFGKVTEKGYRPAVVPGLCACALAPVATYFYGEAAIPLVLMLAFVAAAASFVGAHGVESGPLPNMAVTTLGISWIALLGSYAGVILALNWQIGFNVGTDTMFMVALGVAANDIGALMVGSAIGKSPMRAWISPSKTIEGLLGGTVVTFFAVFIAGQIVSDSNVWSQNKWALLLALTIAVLAPLGDLTESMFKRNLEIKDFGTIVQGHGGVLDRFDGFLFVLPGAFYLVRILA